VIYYPTVMARYSLSVLKVPLNPKQRNTIGLRFGLGFGLGLEIVVYKLLEKGQNADNSRD